ALGLPKPLRGGRREALQGERGARRADTAPAPRPVRGACRRGTGPGIGPGPDRDALETVFARLSTPEWAAKLRGTGRQPALPAAAARATAASEAAFPLAGL